jgi:hypothetical protein
MTTPSNPTPDATSGPVPAPVPSGSPTDADIRALAAQLTSMADSGVACSLSQGTVVATSPTTSPPTASITLSGSTTQVDGVRFLSSYSPQVNDTVQVLKQGGSLLILGHTADLGTSTATSGGWQTPTLSSGFTTNGNSNGNLQYRLVMDNGLWKVQWIGSVAHSGSNTTIIAAGVIPSQFRPTAKRSILVPRDVQGGSNVAQIDFGTDGSVALVGGTTVPGGSTTSAGGHSHYDGYSDTQLSGYLSQAGSDLGHAHYLGYTDTQGDHSHTMSLTVSAPTWLSFNMVSYFI